jgi:hypothetical protein
MKSIKSDVLFKNLQLCLCVALLFLPSAQSIKNIVAERYVLSEISAKHHIYPPAALLYLFNPKATQ